MKHYLVKVFKNKENWCFQSWLIHLIVVNLSNCISVSLFKGKILVSDNTIFEVLVVKQTCIIVIIKMAKWKGQKSKHCFTQERSWHFINNRFSYLGMLRPFHFGGGGWALGRERILLVYLPYLLPGLSKWETRNLSYILMESFFPKVSLFPELQFSLCCIQKS